MTGRTKSRHGAVDGTARVSALFTARFDVCVDLAGEVHNVAEVSTVFGFWTRFSDGGSTHSHE